MADCSITHAFVLHQVAYRETSALVDFVTASDGWVRAVCRGVKTNGKAGARMRSVLQPFAELELQLTGKSELKNVRGVEVLSPAPVMNQQQLYAAIYINEVTQKLSVKYSGGGMVFYIYKAAVIELGNQIEVVGTSIQKNAELEKLLRAFELNLLAALGFEIDFNIEGLTGEMIRAQKQYHFTNENGFVDEHCLSIKEVGTTGITVGGDQLIKLSKRQFDDVNILATAKKITRAAISYHIEGKPLNARALYR